MNYSNYIIFDETNKLDVRALNIKNSFHFRNNLI